MKTLEKIENGKFIKQETNNVLKPYITKAKPRMTKNSNKCENIEEEIVEVTNVTHLWIISIWYYISIYKIAISIIYVHI